MFGVPFAELLLFVAVPPAGVEPRPLNDVMDVELLSTDVELLLDGDRAMTDDGFCFGGVFMGGVSSQLSQLSSRDTLVSRGVRDALSS